jgi:uncharacterized protein YprB with RNaseH-like and TPR domain
VASSSTLDDLRRIIRRIESSRPPRLAPDPVEIVVGGELVETGAGALVRVRREFPLSHAHGRRALAGAFAMSPDVLRLLAGTAEAPADPRRLVFLDTETTGLAGGTGTYAFLVGAGRLDGDRFVVEQYFLRDFDDEPALLAVLGPVLAEASGIVSFNGSGFDLPLLETRFVLGRRSWPTAVAHLDLLRPARRVWAASLLDCRLTTLERDVLGLVRSDDVPGALIPALYFDFLRCRRAGPLARVFAHNRDDVLSLAALLGWFADAAEHAGGVGIVPEELAGLGRLWERVDPERAAACYRAALEAGLAGPAAHAVRLRLARWEKRRARWEAACALWEAASRGASFDPRPWEELAKFHEHRSRDVARARSIVTAALDVAQASGASPRILEAFTHRLGRLDRRLAPLR